MIVQITAYITDFFKIESSDNPTCSHGELEKKNCWTSHQGTEHSIFRVILWNRFEVITTMFVQSTTFITDFYKFQSSYSPTSSHGEPERKKKKCWTSQQETEHSIFRVTFFWNTKFCYPNVFPWRARKKKKKKKNPVEPCNREQSTAYSELPFEIGLRLYHFNGCAKYHNFFFINCAKHKFCKMKFEISFWKTVGAEHFVANVNKKLRNSGWKL